METKEFVEIAGDAVEIAGVLLILGGVMVASGRYALARQTDGIGRHRRYRHDLGRAILLGLELLIAADIIQTVTFTPTMDSVLALAMIVLIRTFLSWSLALELDGRWPWQRAAEPIDRGAAVTERSRTDRPGDARAMFRRR